MSRTLALAAALVVASAPLAAHDFSIGDLQISHPYAFETPPMALAGGGFLTITNTGDTADRLVAVRADFPKVEIHETVVTDGVGKMLPVDGIDIAPGQEVTLRPGGYHVMFMGLDDQLVEGETVPATLVFERAGEVAVEFTIEKRPAGEAMRGHGHMHGQDGMTTN